MEARLVRALPEEPGWQFEPKWDGFRCLAIRTGATLELRAKSGKSLARYFPEVVELLQSLAAKDFVLDGELIVPDGETTSFDSLQQRIHPAASRIKKLSAATPATFEAFDCLLTAAAGSLISRPLSERRVALEKLVTSFGRVPRLRLSPYTRDLKVAQRWLEIAGGALDGVIAKRIDGPYVPGERAMLKVKRVRTADCVVGGFRYGTGTRTVGSLLLGLYDSAGKLNHVGFTSAIARAERAELTRKLKARIAPPGFTGRAPGGPSRWSTERSSAWEPLRPDLVVEVCYDQVTGDRFRHGTRLLRWRPDKSPTQCTFEQLEAPSYPWDG